MKVENYKMVRLGDVCEIVNGFAFDSKLFNTEKKGTPLIRIRDVIRGFSETYTTETVDSRFLIKSGDLLIGMDGEFNCSLWKSEDSFLNQRVCKIVPNEDLIHKDYVYYGLQGKLKEIEDKTAFVTVKHISSKQIENIILKQPPLETQKHIAAVLDKCTSVIAKHREMLAKYDTLIKSRFIEMFGDPVSNPMGWDEVRITELCKSPDDIKCGPFGTQLSKDEYQKAGVPVFGIPQINSSFKILPTDFLTNSKAEKLDDYSLVCGDIAMSRKGNVGKCAIYSGQDKGIIHSDVVRLRVDNSICNPVYLMNQLHISPKVETQISNVSSGAIMAGINVTKLKNIIVYNPPILIQNDFAAFVQQIDKSKFAVQKSLDKAETLYKALMQEYFGA